MKKFKVLTPLMASLAAVTPAMTTLTSCGKVDMSEIASLLKDSTISIFMDMSKTTHRNVWDEEEAFNYVVRQMQEYGISEYSGRDYWSEIPEVEEQIYLETGKHVGERGYPDYGNVWFDIPATSGKENAPAIILQAHLDSQIAFASDEAKLNWIKNGINVTFDNDNDILSTDQQTSLGADGGIGTALLLSLAKYQNKFPHGPLRLLFTAGESEATTTFAAGASFLKNDQENRGIIGEKEYLEKGSLVPFGAMDEFKYLISTGGTNNKSIYRSTAGIHECSVYDSALQMNVDREDDKAYTNKLLSSMTYKGTTYPMHLYSVSIDGLHGGHSATDINNGYANALMILMKLVYSSDQLCQIVSASSLPGAYAIASSGKCLFTSDLSFDEIKAKRDKILTLAKEQCPIENWAKINFNVEQLDDSLIGTEGYKWALSPVQSWGFSKMLGHELQFGPIDWFDEEHKYVKTSFNHGALTLKVNQDGGDSLIDFHIVLRSATDDDLKEWRDSSHYFCQEYLSWLYPNEDPKERIKEMEKHISHMENPVWESDADNKLVDLIGKGYKKIGITPSIIDNHGWVEAGCMPDVFKAAGTNEFKIACVGVQVNNNHEVDETCYTDSLNTLNKALVYTLMNVQSLEESK